MKKIILLFALVFGAVSCNNEKFEFDDYDIHTVYFPWQYPVRTLSLGNDALDNSIDREHKFSVGVALGGVWKYNKNEYSVKVEIDNSLVPDNLYNDSDQKIEALPSDYYTISSTDLIIPKGEFVGKMTVQLNDEFFQDKKALAGIYVLPLKIVDTSADSVLTGVPVVNHPNIHNLSDYESNRSPKDFTLFAVKYVNPYHGKFLRRYKIDVYDPSGELIETKVMSAQDPERNQVVGLKTISMTEVVSDFAGDDNAGSKMTFKVNEKDNSVEILPVEGSKYQVSGTGSWVVDGDAWGVNQDGTPKKRDVFRLDYSYTDANGNKCAVKDTVVFRDRQIKFELFSPVLK